MLISTIPPIVIYEIEQTSSDVFASIDSLHESISEAAKDVLEIMLKNKMTLVPERKAVWLKSKLETSYPLSISTLTRMIGRSFPDKQFEDSCFKICQEKDARTAENDEHICSHESRDPKEGKWGGSIKVIFNLVYATDNGELVICTISPSGLKEWEDLALGLGILYYLGFIQFEHTWVQVILRRVERSVEGQPEFQPEGMSITEYVKNLFGILDQVKQD